MGTRRCCDFVLECLACAPGLCSRKPEGSCFEFGGRHPIIFSWSLISFVVANQGVSVLTLRRTVLGLVRAMNRIFLVVPNPRVSGLTLSRRVSGLIG